MKISEELDKHKAKIKSLYDFVACCYCHLCNVLKSKKCDQGTFISEYIEKGTGGANNPNLNFLLQFENNLRSIIEYSWGKVTEFGECLWIAEAIEEIEKAEKELIYFKGHSKVLSRETLTYFVLKVLDEKAKFLLTDNQQDRSNKKSLNNFWDSRVRIYYKPRFCFWEETKINLKFPVGRIRQKNIAHSFEVLQIVDKESYGMLWDSEINLYEFSLGKKWDEGNIRKKKLRIAIIPFTSKEDFSFSTTVGSAFSVNYAADYSEKQGNKILELIELAIEVNCNIILFPEYVCSPDVQEKIKHYLEQNDSGKLLFLVAGSGWTVDNNNVLSVFAYNGESLGNQYKHSGFDGKIKDHDFFEKLHDPGKTITILDVQKFGRVAFAICRDVCDESVNCFADAIVDCFEPDFFFVPAWSNSVDRGFLQKFENYAARTVTSVLCDCCAARSQFQGEVTVGLVTFPMKDKMFSKSVSHKTEDVVRPSNCGADCEISDCIYLADLCYDKESVTSGKICQSIKQCKKSRLQRKDFSV